MNVLVNSVSFIYLCQIRVHLQYTGHPIANDMLYLDESAGRRSTAGTGVDRAAARLRDSLSWEISGNNEDSEEESVNNFSKDPMCTHCPSLAPNG